MHAPWSLQILQVPRATAIAHECSGGTTKGLKVYKFVDSIVHTYNCFKLYLQHNLVLLFVICKIYKTTLQELKCFP